MVARAVTTALAVLAVLCLAGAQSGANLRHADYRGTLDGDAKTKVAIKVVQGGQRVLFEARRFEIHCIGGSSGRQYFAPVKAKLTDDGTFDVDQYTYTAGSFAPDTERYYRVHGQVLGNGTVHGFLSYTRAVLTSPPEHCSSRGKWHWTAS